MTPGEWKLLGELVRQRVVLELGITARTLDAVTQEVATVAEAAKLPPRTIAAVRLPRTDGKRSRRLYVKRTLAWLLPREYQQ